MRRTYILGALAGGRTARGRPAPQAQGELERRTARDRATPSRRTYTRVPAGRSASSDRSDPSARVPSIDTERMGPGSYIRYRATYPRPEPWADKNWRSASRSIPTSTPEVSRPLRRSCLPEAPTAYGQGTLSADRGGWAAQARRLARRCGGMDCSGSPRPPGGGLYAEPPRGTGLSASKVTRRSPASLRPRTDGCAAPRAGSTPARTGPCRAFRPGT